MPSIAEKLVVKLMATIKKISMKQVDLNNKLSKLLIQFFNLSMSIKLFMLLFMQVYHKQNILKSGILYIFPFISG